MAERKRIYPPVYFLLSLLLMAAGHFLLPLATLIDSPVGWVGVPLILVGVGLAAWCNRMFKRADTTIKPFEVSSALVTHGPFAYSRNPIYLGMVLTLLGAAVLFGTLAPFLIILPFIVLIDSVFIRGEEAILVNTFGDEYAEYCRRVRRWI